MVRCGWPPEASCSAASAAAVVVAASFAHGSVAGSAASHSTDAGPTYQFINNSFDLVSNTSKAKQVNVKSSFKSSPSFFFFFKLKIRLTHLTDTIITIPLPV